MRSSSGPMQRAAELPASPQRVSPAPQLRERWFSGRWTWLVLAVVILITAGIQLRLIKEQGLWVDEVFSVAVATGHSVEHAAAIARPELGDFTESASAVSTEEIRKYGEHEHPAAPLSRVVRATFLSDTSPPLYYLLLSGWTRVLGVSDADVRSLSVLCTLLCFPVVLWLGCRSETTAVGVIGLLLFAASPTLVYYGGEARMYAQLWLCVVASAAFTLLLERTQSGRKLWLYSLGWCAAGAAGFWTHYFFLFPWAAMVAYLALRLPRRTWLAQGARCAGVVGLVLPWYVHVPESLSNWRVTQDWLTMVPANFNRAESILDQAAQFFSGHGKYLWWDHPTAERLSLAVFALAGIFWLWRERGRAFAGPRLFLWLWFLAAWAGPVVFDWARGTYTVAVPRYTITALPAACLLGAIALVSLPRVPRVAGLAIVLVCWSLQISGMLQDRDRNDQNFWHVGWWLDRHSDADDLILVHSIPSGAVAVARYTHSPAKMAAWVEQLGNRRVPQSIEELARGRSRVVYVNVHAVGAPAPEEEWLRAHGTILAEEKFGAARLVQFAPSTGNEF
jgi:hypothetical protein